MQRHPNTGSLQLPSFHSGYYWHSLVISKDQKGIFPNHKEMRGSGRSSISRVLRVTRVQTGKLALLLRHHVWQEEIKIEVTIIIILTCDLLTLPVSRMTVCRPCQARQSQAELWAAVLGCWVLPVVWKASQGKGMLLSPQCPGRPSELGGKVLQVRTCRGAVRSTWTQLPV